MLDEMRLELPRRGVFVLRLDTSETAFRAEILRDFEGEITPSGIRTPWRDTPVEAYAAAVRRLLHTVSGELSQAQTPRTRKDAGSVRLRLNLKGAR